MAAQQLIRFEGNCPGNVSRDAKYTIRWENRQLVVGMTYVTDDGERWYPTNIDHPDLVTMVNAIKEAVANAPAGSFYINEFHQVIVPTVNGSDYYLAGEYHKPLEFDFEGHVLSGNAVDLQGQPLRPGDRWVGPHPGIPYVLTAGARDIYYEIAPRPDVTRQVKLSQSLERAALTRLCAMLREVKGYEGGRFYINEFRHLFAPINANQYVDYIYVGRLDNIREWFPKPHTTTSR
jgi:hypothetical protein